MTERHAIYHKAISGIRIERYTSAMRNRWDEFVVNSRTATFLFMRDYMDYHADRFTDCSWLAYKNDKLVAMLPASLDHTGVLHSHGGLTYGGWILPPAHLDGGDLLDIFTEAMAEWQAQGISALDYKPLPTIYASSPGQEDRYALFRLGATISEVNLSAAIDLSATKGFNQQQRRHLKSALKLSHVVREMDDIAAFMALLEQCLQDRHSVQPVHTADEMRLLATRFPGNIKFFATYLDGSPEAAVCIYDTGIVAHAQYIATTPKGRELNLLTPLFDFLIHQQYSGRRYFDFGISNEDHGRYLNRGLLRQKYSYGATGVAYERYYLEL